MSPLRTRRFAHRSGTGARSRAGARAKTATIYVLASLATLGVAGTSGAHYGGGSPTLNAPAAPLGHAFTAFAGKGTPDRVRSLRLAGTGESWPFSFFKSLFGIEDQSAPRRRPEQYRRAPKPVPRAAAPAGVPPLFAPGNDAPATEVATTYRTMCVRLCDGYYWPVSFATLKDNLERDERTCAQSCSASVALYHYPNPGAEVEDMVNLQGLPYKDLATAFLHRTTYDPNCKCRPHPWEAEAIARHKSYANTSQPRAVAQGQRRAR